MVFCLFVCELDKLEGRKVDTVRQLDGGDVSQSVPSHYLALGNVRPPSVVRVENLNDRLALYTVFSGDYPSVCIHPTGAVTAAVSSFYPNDGLPDLPVCVVPSLIPYVAPRDRVAALFYRQDGAIVKEGEIQILAVNLIPTPPTPKLPRPHGDGVAYVQHGEGLGLLLFRQVNYVASTVVVERNRDRVVDNIVVGIPKRRSRRRLRKLDLAKVFPRRPVGIIHGPIFITQPIEGARAQPLWDVLQAGHVLTRHCEGQPPVRPHGYVVGAHFDVFHWHGEGQPPVHQHGCVVGTLDVLDGNAGSACRQG